MKLTVDQLVPLAHARADRANIASVVGALDTYGGRVGLDQPHRIVHYLAQIMHESGRFRYDQEVWGPTQAQQRYDTRTDLGNTPERDGDGELYKGRTGIQITGRDNYRQFRDWCREIGLTPPDFVARPSAVNSDPWEGLGPIWYWSTRNLNRYADINDIEMITRRINGGLNGFADRLVLYTAVGLLWLGYGGTKEELKRFQASAKATGAYTGDVDGIDGPKTRAAIHKGLVELGTVRATKAAPVTEDVAVPVANSESTAPLNTGLSLVGLGGVVTAMGDFLGGLHPIVQGGALLLIAAGAVVVWRDRAKIAKAARQILAGRG
jgi:putative chitinase